MSASPFQRFIPFLAVLGSVTALGVGTSWAEQALFPVVGAQGTTAVRVGLSALLMLMLWRPGAGACRGPMPKRWCCMARRWAR